jgi:hypothetical protein
MVRPVRAREAERTPLGRMGEAAKWIFGGTEILAGGGGRTGATRRRDPCRLM